LAEGELWYEERRHSGPPIYNDLQSKLPEIAAALRLLKPVRPPERQWEDRVKSDLLKVLHGYLVRGQNADAMRLVEDLQARGLRIDAAQHGNSDNVDVATHGDPVLAIGDLSLASLDRRPSPPDNDDPLFGKIVHRELTRVSQHAHDVVREILESENDPARQWERVVGLMQVNNAEPAQDIDVDLSDNSFLYSR
jgi:hypothetical protein